jgi:hypothetical protein
MELGKHIAAIRGRLNAFGETESPITDEFIYIHLSANAGYFTRQKYDRTNKINYQNLKFYRLATKKAPIIDCGDCIPECEYLRTVYTIPEMLLTRNGILISVRTIDHKEIPQIDMSYSKALDYDQTRKGKLHYSIVNNYIVIHNSDGKRPKAILVAGYAADCTLWKNISECDNNGENPTPTCTDIFELEFPLDKDLQKVVYDATVEELTRGVAPGDRINEGDNPVR